MPTKQPSNEPGLTDREHAMLVFEDQRWRYPGAKATAIADQFGLTTIRYYAELQRIIDLPAAAAAEPMLVARLRRLRDARAEQRSARRLGEV